MPDARPYIFGDVRVEDNFDIERLFFHNTECRLEVTLDRKIRRLIEGLPCLFQGLDALDRERPALFILLDTCEQVQSAAAVPQAVPINGMALILHAVDR